MQWFSYVGFVTGFNPVSLCMLQVEDFVGKISKRGLLQQQHLMRLLVDDNSGMKPGEERHTSPHDLVCLRTGFFYQLVVET